MRIGYLMEKGEDIRRPPYNGPATHVRDVVQELCRRGHTVRVLFHLDGRLWITDDLETFRPVIVPAIDRGPLRLLERGVRSVQATLKLPFLGWFNNLRFALACRQELSDCEVFFERMSWIMAGGLWASRRMRIPLVLEYNGDPLADLEAAGIAPRGLQRRISIAQMKRILQGADHVVATGDGWRETCIRRWGVQPEKATTVENGTDLVRRLARHELRSFQSDPPEQPPTLVFLGGFYAWHGVIVLLRSLPRVLERFPHARLLLIGAGNHEAEARRLVERLDLAANVSFLGRMTVEAYAPLLAGADIGVSPYCGRPEYTGLKIYDYKAAGLPVVASGTGGQPRCIRPGETGLLAPPCQEDELAEALCTLLADADLRRKMGRNARLEAEAGHGWEHVAANLEQVLEQALPARRAG